uniref:Replication protein 1a n=1 Tax=Macrophomina phaseolina ilar-like virus TaxID=2741660 RepID=A0A7U3VD74_9BROM|nr:replicase [Macrophomina phaseolina ilar-like virus]
MTTRIRDWGSTRRDDDPQRLASQHQATVEVIDEAVEGVLKNFSVDDSTAETMRRLLAADVNSGVAHMYFNGVASSALQRSHVASGRRQLVVPYVLNDKESAELSKYAVDFNLVFRARDVHDHPMAAACRVVDRTLVESRVPPGTRVSDVGGAIIPHLRSEKLGRAVHVCAPLMDRKDPARKVQERMRILRMNQERGISQGQKAAIAAYLDKRPEAVCDLRAQDCSRPADVITSVHVYDIPMEDWPIIMEKKGARLVEGCMLHSTRLFHEIAGEFPVAGARYEIDRERMVFRMGFRGSPSWWYEHNLVDYLKYGVDQVLVGKRGVYSYKIVERRADTIFFRILRVDSATLPEKAHYRLPGVEVVKVRGFGVESRRSSQMKTMQRRTFTWPRPLWEDMVSHAVLLFEKGTLTHDRMYNYYRTIAPRQTINAVLVAGGYEVSIEELLPLIVNSSLVAAGVCNRMRTEVNQMVQGELVRRGRADEWTVYKALAAMGNAVSAAFGVLCFPLVALGRLIERGARAMLQMQIVEWEPQVSLAEVNAKLILSNSERAVSRLGDVVLDDGWLEDHLHRAAPEDPLRAAVDNPQLAKRLLARIGSVVPRQMRLALETSASEVPDEQSEPTLVPSVAGGHVTQTVKEVGARTVSKRDAILEAITEAELEQGKVTAFCDKAMGSLLAAGNPSVSVLRNRAEEFKNPDLWFVEAGLLTRSLVGIRPEDFHHAAIFVPRADEVTGSKIRPVYQEEFKGMSCGEYVEREYLRIADSSYTGWAFVCDALEVYNGPEIVASLKAALDLEPHFSVTLRQGPPGCGKTTSVVQTAGVADVVMSPARQSCKDTKRKILQLKPQIASVMDNRVRTLDSYLVNYGIQKRVKAIRADRLLADEVFMARAGKWYAAALLLGASEIVAFGDENQIPHVPRVETPKQHVVLNPDVKVEEWLTYRCPGSAVAAWGGVFGDKVRSATGKAGKMMHVVSSAGMKIPDGCVMMGMYQADKKILRSMYPQADVKIMTVHESQGNTYPCVWLHRFDNRRRTDNFSLYDKEAYALVAMSRHTDEFVYVAQDVDDLVIRWLREGIKLRRIHQALDVGTAGEPFI